MPKRYTDLNPKACETVDLVISQFADMFDNNDFGPFIQEFTEYDRDRVAGFMELAIGDVEIVVGITGLMWGVSNFPWNRPIAQRCITLALTIEVIRHFIRSYVEIPDTGRVGAPDVVRRDYFTRWQGVLNDYQNQLRDAGKKLTAELYTDGAGHYMKVLVDLPSMRGVAIADAPMERPQMGWWW